MAGYFPGERHAVGRISRREGADLASVQQQSRRHLHGCHAESRAWRIPDGDRACCVGDYDNDGWDDLFVTYFGKNVLYHNNGDGTFTDVSEKAGVAGTGKRWNTGCAFVDYDRDGRLDLFVANYIDLDLATAPVPESGPCLYKSIMVACGPPGLQGGKNILYHNNGDGTFNDVSEAAGILGANGTYGLGVLTADFDNDGWPDIYVANDSTASALYQNKKNGKFQDMAMEAGCALSPDGKPQAGMGVSAVDYDHGRQSGHRENKFCGRHAFAVPQSGRRIF